MRAIVAVWLAVALCLGACSHKDPREADRGALGGKSESKPWFAGAPGQAEGMHLAYKHDIGIAVERSALQAHFVAARDRCVHDVALHCVLLSASSVDDSEATESIEGAWQRANLHLRMPHDLIVPFVNSLTNPLPGESPGVARVRRQSTTAVDLGEPIADVARRLAQLTSYRDKLQALGARADIKVDDLVKIAREMSTLQTQLEAADAEQRALALRVETEELVLGFEEPIGQGAFDEVARAWANGAVTFGNSLGSAIEFAISALPWLPLIAVLLVAARFVRWFVFGGGRTKRVAGPAP